MKNQFILLALCAYFCFTLFGELIYYDEVLISSSYIETRKENVSPSIIVIKAEDIQKSNIKNITDLLNLISGIYLVRNGSEGQVSSMYIRGSRPSQAAVLINGIMVNDPSSVDGSFDFNNISVNEIERIEIIKSAQGSLYGSNAMGGVINIISRENRGKKPFHFFADTGFTSTKGNYQSILLGLSGKYYSLDINLGNEYQKNVYAADPDLIANDCPDPFNKTFGSLKFSFYYRNFMNSTFIRYNYARSNIDLYGGDYGNDPNYISKNKYFSLINNLRFELEPFHINFYIGRLDTRRHYTNEPDEFSIDELDANYSGLTYNSRLSATIFRKLTFGFEVFQHKMSYNYFSDDYYGPYEDSLDEQKQNVSSLFGEYNYSWKNFGIITGLRYDKYDSGEKLTYRFAPFYRFENTGTALYASISTGFKVPSLYELYSPYGNPNLESESSLSYEVSLSQNLSKDQAEFSITFFHNAYENLIDFDNTYWQYYNIGEAETKGFEVSADYKINANLSLKLMSTILSSKNALTGEELLRRPRYKHSLIVSSSLPYNISLWTEALYVSKRDDLVYDENYNAVRTSLDGYFCFNISIEKGITDRFLLYLRADNLFGDDYQYIKGYAKSKRIIYLGLKYSL